jgi:hypothetical protein
MELPAALACPADRCKLAFEVSEVDPDATLSEIRSHLMGAPHYRTHADAMRLLANVEAVA